MKKIFYMVLIIGSCLLPKETGAAQLATPIDYAAAVRNPNAPEQSRYTWPLSHTARRFYPGKKIPAGYTAAPSEQDKHRYVKQILDPEHEYYNQFIEGYVPREYFEREMKYRRIAERPARDMSKKNAEWFRQEAAARRSGAKYRTYLGESMNTEQERIQRMERKMLDRENAGLISRAVNWFKSWWQGGDNKSTSFGTQTSFSANRPLSVPYEPSAETQPAAAVPVKITE